MPRIVRPMLVEADGLPRVGSAAKCLGVREPPSRHADVDLDAAGEVCQNRKGLSVNADWRDLPMHLIPEHLDDGFNGARGKGMRVFVHGAGDFREGAVTAELELLHKPGTSTSGVVAPAAAFTLAAYQQHLAATRPEWSVDES